MAARNHTLRQSSDAVERPGNPVLRRRSLSAYRNSLCLVDDGTGEVVQVLQSGVQLPDTVGAEAESARTVSPSHKSGLLDLPVTPNITPIRRALASSPPFPTPNTRPISPSSPGTPAPHDHVAHRDHSKDTPGGILAHKVDDIVRSIHPRDRDSEFEPEDPDWSGDSDTGLYLLHLERAMREGETLPPLGEWAAVRAAEKAAERDKVHLTGPPLGKSNQPPTGSEDAPYLEREVMVPVLQSKEADSPGAHGLARQVSEVVSENSTHPPVPEEADDVLLEFLGRDSTIRMSRFRPPSGTKGSDSPAPQPLAHLAVPAVAASWTSYIATLAGALSPIALWTRLSAMADWTRSMPAAFVDDAERMAAVDGRKRSAAALGQGRMSVFYFDNVGSAKSFRSE